MVIVEEGNETSRPVRSQPAGMAEKIVITHISCRASLVSSDIYVTQVFLFFS